MITRVDDFHTMLQSKAWCIMFLTHVEVFSKQPCIFNISTVLSMLEWKLRLLLLLEVSLSTLKRTQITHQLKLVGKNEKEVNLEHIFMGRHMNMCTTKDTSHILEGGGRYQSHSRGRGRGVGTDLNSLWPNYFKIQVLCRPLLFEIISPNTLVVERRCTLVSDNKDSSIVLKSIIPDRSPDRSSNMAKKKKKRLSCKAHKET